MRDLRPQLDAARGEYRAARYPGDLADELLPQEPRRRVGFTFWRRGLVLATAAALAALVAVVIWMRWPSDRPGVARGPSSAPPAPAPTTLASTLPVTPPWERALTSLQTVRYDAYVDDVRTGMQQAVAQLSGGVDGAIESPLVSTTAQTVRHVADDLHEVALAVGAQFRPREQ